MNSKNFDNNETFLTASSGNFEESRASQTAQFHGESIEKFASQLVDDVIKVFEKTYLTSKSKSL